MSDQEQDLFLLSVVIPVANMAGKLSKLRESLRRIPTNSVEVLLVDDHQDEATGKELNEIIVEIGNKNIKLITGVFGNPGSARNAGIDNSSGQWITFWDSDDEGFIDPVIREIERAGAEVAVVIGQFQIHDVVKNVFHSYEPFKTISQIPKSPGIWRFVFRNFNLVRFKSLSMGEDQLFLVSNLPQFKKIKISKEYFYCYTIGNSYQLTYSKSKIDDLWQASKELQKIKVINDPERLHLIDSMMLRMNVTLFKYGDTFAKPTSIFKMLILFPRYITYELRKMFSTLLGKRNRKSILISVTGGLGNQLFQVAAANALSNSEAPDAIFGLGIPRKASNGKPDILEFKSDEIINKIDLRNANWFFRKVAGYNLRMGVMPRRYETNVFFEKSIKFFQVLLSQYMSEK